MQMLTLIQPCTAHKAVSSFQPCRFLILAHFARCAARIFANPAAEIRRRFGAIDTTLWPRVRAQRAFCAAEILALIFLRRGWV